MSKIKSGRLSLHKEEFVINKLVQEMIDEVGHINTSYQFHFSEEVAELVYADRERIGKCSLTCLPMQ